MEKNIVEHKYKLRRRDRIQKNGHNSFLVFFTGLSGSGQSTLANALEQKLYADGISTYVLDGDNVRKGINSDLSFEPKDRSENIRRIAEVSGLKSITLEDDIDISRGDMIVRTKNKPESSQDVEVMLCWLNHESAKPRAKYLVRHTTNEQTAMIKEVVYKIDINNLSRNSEDKELSANDICKVKLKTTKPLHFDSYRDNRNTGSLVLIDPLTNQTVAAGMIVS